MPALLPVRRNDNNGFTVVRVHYSADPDKQNSLWIKEAKKGIGLQAWQREYEISYDVFSGKPIFPEFKEDLHLRNLKYNKGNPIFRGWDFGFHHPAVVISQLNQYDQWEILENIIGNEEGIEHFAKRVRLYCLVEYPGAKYADTCDIHGLDKSDKDDKTSVQVLNTLGIFPTARKTPINEGMEIIRKKLMMRDDGKVGMLVNRNPKAKDIVDGFKGGYRYKETLQGKIKEEPEKDGWYDHCVCGDTSIKTSKGDKGIKYIKAGDKVLTRKGYRKVLEKFNNGKKFVKSVILSNGKRIVGTGDHKIWVVGKGWVVIDKLRYSDRMLSCEKLIGQTANQNKLSSTVLDTTAIRKLKEGVIGFISQKQMEKDYMWRFGKGITIKKFLLAITSIIKTVILLIIKLPIWFVLKLGNIFQNMYKSIYQFQKTYKNSGSIVQRLDRLLRNGMAVKKGKSGIRNTVRKHGRIRNNIKMFVYSAIKNLRHFSLSGESFAQINVNRLIEELLVSMIYIDNVLFAGNLLRLINTLRKRRVPQNAPFVVAIIPREKKERVYNFAVHQHHEYFANGILIMNCFDCMRYICTTLFNIAGVRQMGNPITKDGQNPLVSMFSEESPSSNSIVEDEGMSSYF